MALGFFNCQDLLGISVFDAMFVFWQCADEAGEDVELYNLHHFILMM